MYEIRKDIPLPMPFGASRRKWRWGDMEPGDSVTIPPGPDIEKAKNSLNAYKAYHREKRFVRRTLVDGSLRIWREV